MYILLLRGNSVIWISKHDSGTSHTGGKYRGVSGQTQALLSAIQPAIHSTHAIVV